jgi:hypothetical protein
MFWSAESEKELPIWFLEDQHQNLMHNVLLTFVQMEIKYKLKQIVMKFKYLSIVLLLGILSTECAGWHNA